MTKLLINMDLLAYRLEMVDTLRQVLMQNYITGAPQPRMTGSRWREFSMSRQNPVGYVMAREECPQVSQSGPRPAGEPPEPGPRARYWLAPGFIFLKDKNRPA